MELTSKLAKAGLATGGLVAGVVLAGTMTAQASSPSPTATSGPTSGSTAQDPHPGDNGADGVPESQEHHGGGRGGGLGLSGTVTAVGTSSVTIKSSAGTPTTYAVTGGSDIDKNGEAALKDLVVGDAVTFSVDASTTKTIDKLHAGDEAKDRPSGPPPAGTAPSGAAATSPTA